MQKYYISLTLPNFWFSFGIMDFSTKLYLVVSQVKQLSIFVIKFLILPYFIRALQKTDKMRVGPIGG